MERGVGGGATVRRGVGGGDGLGLGKRGGKKARAGDGSVLGKPKHRAAVVLFIF
jgi:hypothetical protein